MKLSLICPCYNESDNIEAFYKTCTDVLDGKVEGRKNERGMLGLDHVLTMHGVNINYGASQVK